MAERSARRLGGPSGALGTEGEAAAAAIPWYSTNELQRCSSTSHTDGAKQRAACKNQPCKAAQKILKYSKFAHDYMFMDAHGESGKFKFPVVTKCSKH